MVNTDAETAVSYANGLKAPEQAGFAVVGSDGTVLAQHDASTPVAAESVTDAMLLVAYLRMLGSQPIPAAAEARLQALIEQTDPQASQWAFSQVGAGRVQSVARDAGMTAFTLSTSPDSAGALGDSRVTVLDQARLFAKIDQLIPNHPPRGTH